MAVFLGHVAPRHMFVVGDFGVTVFFFLSGFLIATLMRSELLGHLRRQSWLYIEMRIAAASDWTIDTIYAVIDGELDRIVLHHIRASRATCNGNRSTSAQYGTANKSAR